MSISSVLSGSNNSASALESLISNYDVNSDGNLSNAEFASFLKDLVSELSGGQFDTLKETDSTTKASATVLTSLDTSTTAAVDTTSEAWRGRMLGFDFSRMESARGTLKYDAARVMQAVNPDEPGAMQKVYQILNQMHPGEYRLDEQENLFLESTADGYIGVRPLDRSENWENPPSGRIWQWMCYNTAHPGPNGEIT